MIHFQPTTLQPSFKFGKVFGVRSPWSKPSFTLVRAGSSCDEHERCIDLKCYHHHQSYFENIFFLLEINL